MCSRHHDTEAEEVRVWLTDAAQTDALHFIIHAKYKWHLGQRMYHNGRGFSYNLYNTQYFDVADDSHFKTVV